MTKEIKKVVNYVKCSDCGGAGYLQDFTHMYDGFCIECGGMGIIADGWKEIEVEVKKSLDK